MTGVVHGHSLDQQEVARGCYSITIYVSAAKRERKLQTGVRRQVRASKGRVLGERVNARSVEKKLVNVTMKPLFSRRAQRSLHRQLSASDRP